MFFYLLEFIKKKNRNVFFISRNQLHVFFGNQQQSYARAGQKKKHIIFFGNAPANTVRNITFVKVPFSSFMNKRNDVLRT